MDKSVAYIRGEELRELKGLNERSEQEKRAGIQLGLEREREEM